MHWVKYGAFALVPQRVYGKEKKILIFFSPIFLRRSKPELQCELTTRIFYSDNWEENVSCICELCMLSERENILKNRLLREEILSVREKSLSLEVYIRFVYILVIFPSLLLKQTIRVLYTAEACLDGKNVHTFSRKCFPSDT